VFFLSVHICLFLLSVSVFVTNKRVHISAQLQHPLQKDSKLVIRMLICKK